MPQIAIASFLFERWKKKKQKKKNKNGGKGNKNWFYYCLLSTCVAECIWPVVGMMVMMVVGTEKSKSAVVGH